MEHYQSQTELPVQHRFRLSGIALVEGLTYAEEDIQASIECRLCFACARFVRLIRRPPIAQYNLCFVNVERA